MIRPFSARRPIIMGSITGSYLGIILWLGWLLVSGNLPEGPGWAVPLVAMVYGAFIVPLAAVGLLIFGLPAAQVVEGDFRAWWLPIASLIMGAIGGKILASILYYLLWQNFRAPWGGGLIGPEIVIGAATGLCFWWFERKWRIADEYRRRTEGEWSADFDPENL